MEERINIFLNLINSAIREKDELLFNRCWNKNSYNRPFSGPEAISGANLFLELTDNELHLSLDTADFENHDTGLLLIGVFVKSTSNTATDYIYILIRESDDTFIIEAVSRSRLELEAIIENKITIYSPEKTETTAEKSTTSNEDSILGFFKEINIALNSHSETKFTESWIEKGFYHNLSGEGGLSGKELFTIATNAAWHLNPIPELSSLFENPQAMLIHLSIWLKALEMEKPGEEGLVLLIISNGQLKILGYGTDMSAMRHLYLKYKEGAVL
jgi:hypothetical protein